MNISRLMIFKAQNIARLIIIVGNGVRSQIDKDYGNLGKTERNF